MNVKKDMMFRVIVVSLLYLVVFQFDLLADGKELYKAVTQNDTETVRSLIETGADVNEPIEEMNSATPVYIAVRNGNIEITEMLLQAGAYIDYRALPLTPPYPWGGNSLLSVALSDQDREMIDLLLYYGADRDEMRDYYTYSLCCAIVRNDIQRLKTILPQMTLEQMYNLPIALCYEHAAREAKIFLDAFFGYSKRTTPEVLTQLLALEGKRAAVYGTLPGVKFPLSSSFLQDENDPRRYDKEKAFDGEKTTSWVEGAKGPGIGERIAFRIPEGSTGISLLPGYGEETYFPLNNRLKEAELSTFFLQEGITERATKYSVKKLDAVILQFKDRMEFQSFDFTIPAEKIPSAPGFLFGVLEIKQVYQGSRWDDTCIAEIVLN
jgi:hypothetical protein